MLSYYLIPLYYSSTVTAQAVYVHQSLYKFKDKMLHKLLVNWTSGSDGTASFIFDAFNSFPIKGKILNIITSQNNDASDENYSIELLDLTGNDILQQQLTNINYQASEIYSPYKETANDNIIIYGQSKLTLYISSVTPDKCGTIKILLLY